MDNQLLNVCPYCNRDGGIRHIRPHYYPHMVRCEARCFECGEAFSILYYQGEAYEKEQLEQFMTTINEAIKEWVNED